MEAALLGFEEVPLEDDTNSSSSRKLVPWLNWNEWLSISSWRSRGSLPDAIDVTATIVEIQHMDPFFRQDQLDDGSVSEEILINLYTMAIVRLVNITVEKTRTKERASISEGAVNIGIPRMLVDVRHEGSHHELPSLKVARSASVKALDWLKSYYWEPQSKAIPFQGKGNADVKKKIKSTIRELAICVKVSGSPQSSTLLKGKRVKHVGLPFGRNKLLSVVVGKSQTSHHRVPKKQITRILKSVIQLYSSFSSEIVSVLLDYLLKTLSSSEFKKNVDDASVGPTIENVLADWKPVILKLCNKKPELLLNLLKEVLHKIEAQEDMKCEEDNSSQGFHQNNSSQGLHQSAYLSSLFAWLVRIHDKETSVANMPKRILHELVRKCLLISRLCNKEIMDSALHLAKLMDDKSLLKKVQLLSGLALSNIVDNADDQNSSLTSINVSQFEESLREDEGNRTTWRIKQRISNGRG
ncbi:hypothetical protein P8452_49271 [Trifolium repens]|nr:hypothetical protein P8452_49271 [Trifolium repens]